MKATRRHHLVFIFALLACSILFALPVAAEAAAASPNTSDNAGRATAAPAEDHYDVWFDGTVGMSMLIRNSRHAGLPAWYDGATDVHEQVLASDGKVVLPENAGTTVRYDYVLNGWYDVIHGVYYGRDRLGTEVPVSGNTVFYADWVPASYNLGTSAREKVSGQPDTTDFITTHLFDYNEMFNLRSAKSVNAGYATLTSDKHLEYWRMMSDGSSLGFAFLNWAYNDAADYGNIAALAGLNGSNLNKTNITQGILNDSIKEDLFTHSNGLGRTYVGTGDYLYQYVDDPSDADYGYYYYDSAKNGASYNQAESRFYVYAQPEKVHEQKLNKTLGLIRNPTWKPPHSCLSTITIPVFTTRKTDRSITGLAWRAASISGCPTTLEPMETRRIPARIWSSASLATMMCGYVWTASLCWTLAVSTLLAAAR